jgi:DMSO/TMAO reductase YedYZ heme-binding membrane subunit
MNIMQFQMVTGLTVFLFVTWQLTTGLRWLKLGRNHFQIHRLTGITLFVLAIPHLINGLRISGVLRF